MDQAEAANVAETILAALRMDDYESLAQRVGSTEWREVEGADALIHRVQIQVFEDDGRAGRNLRVMVAVDDGERRSFVRPLTRDFSVAPDGSFVGED